MGLGMEGQYLISQSHKRSKNSKGLKGWILFLPFWKMKCEGTLSH